MPKYKVAQIHKCLLSKSKNILKTYYATAILIAQWMERQSYQYQKHFIPHISPIQYILETICCYNLWKKPKTLLTRCVSVYLRQSHVGSFTCHTWCANSHKHLSKFSWQNQIDKIVTYVQNDKSAKLLLKIRYVLYELCTSNSWK